jgi:hypothetical protein
MKRCSTCLYDNQEKSVYCERCGAYLDTVSSPLEPTVKASGETLIPPPPPPPLSSYQLSQGVQTQSKLHKRTVGETIFSVVLYVWGTFVFMVGLVGGFFSSVQSNPVIFMSLYLLVCLVFLIPLLLYRTHMWLKWGKRLALEIGLLVIGIILIVIVSQTVNPAGNTSSTADHVIGVSLILYGLATAFVAFW